MFYYNLGYHFALREGSPDAGGGSVILASAMPPAQLIRRQFKKYPHLQHRLFDPQLYLARLDPHLAPTAVAKLAPYPWFGVSIVPPFDSGAQTLSQWKEAAGEELRAQWTRSVISEQHLIESAVREAVMLQIQLGCEGIILPVPMTDSPRRGYVDEATWIDAGIAVCKELRVRVPIYATIAVTDVVLRGADPVRDALLDTITSHIATRDELAGAYLVVEQASEEGYCCTSGDTTRAILVLVDDLVRGASKRVIVNYAGAFGAVTSAVGASVWSSGYYRSLRRLRLVDFDDREGRAYPRYFSLALLGDVSPEADLNRVAGTQLFKSVRTETKAAQLLHTRLDARGSASEVADWVYSIGNLGGAIPHYNEAMHSLGTHLDSLGMEARIDFVHKLLKRAARLAAELRQLQPRLSNRTDLSHQQAWLTSFEEWRSRAGL